MGNRAGKSRKAPKNGEPACMLCHQAAANPDVCGHKLEADGLCAHEFCLFFANKLSQQGVEEVGLRGFLPEDIRHTINWAAQQHCFICGESGAAITCWETGCDRSFHLPCATDGECVTQFLFQYRSFCWEHSPKQTVEAAPEDDTTCLICLDLVGDRRSYSVMVCPACKHAWFHRGCIQGQAVRDGISRFQCPLCRDRDAFLSEMLTMGIRIPFRLPSWDSLAYGALSERHSRCDASECLCPGGRGQVDEEGPWQLLLCCSCASEGTHRGCSYLWNNTSSWECDSCAGLGTASSTSPELAGPTTPSQAEPGSPCSSPSHQASSRSSLPGPMRARDCSRWPRQASNPYHHPRRHHRSSRTPARRARSSTRSLGVPGPSHGSQPPETSSHSQLPSLACSSSPPLDNNSCSSPPGPMRARYHLRHQATNPYSQTGRRCRTIHAPSSSAGPEPPRPAQ
ncbi:PHD finger protein 7-like [Patagioenas fasciata]|uniref:PHD finger protein 7-like n=1 Tax=Patagioenas fasciata TaxID=372321 RepID=UPI0032E92FF4